VLEYARDLGPDTPNFYSASAAYEVPNVKSNRYYDIVPYDRNRVLVPDSLDSSSTAQGGRYINASWVRENAGGKYWVASQAVMPNTIHAFLSLLIQPLPLPVLGSAEAARYHRIRTIIQLTLNKEHGRTKAFSYLPVLIGQTIVVPPDPVIQLQPELAVTPLPSFSITLVAQKEFPEAECIASTLQLSLVLPEGTPCNPIYCNHLLYTAWPDHGVPERRSTLIDFARMAESINQDPGLLCPLAQEAALDHSSTDPNDYPPMIAGCSAGVGRTGTFIAVSSLLRKYGLLSLSAEPMTIVPSKLPESPFGPLPPAIHEDLVALEIDALRDQRNRMVQTIQQVVFIYDVLMEALMKEQLMQA